MHYSAYAFSRNGRPTIESRNQRVSSGVMGQRERLSNKDIQHANALYCTGTTHSVYNFQWVTPTSSCSFSQLTQLAGAAGVPGVLAVGHAMEAVATDLGHVREGQAVVGAAPSRRPATPSPARRWLQCGQTGGNGVGALPPVVGADRAGPGSVSMETHAVDPLLSTGTATHRVALRCGLPGPHGPHALSHVEEGSRGGAESV